MSATKLIAALSAVFLAATMTVSSAEAGGCGRGLKSIRNLAHAGLSRAHSVKRQALASVGRRAGGVAAAKTSGTKSGPVKVETKVTGASEGTGTSTGKSAGDVKVASAEPVCTRFVPAIAASVPVECPH